MTIEFLLVLLVAAGLFGLLEYASIRVSSTFKPRPVPVRIDDSEQKRRR